MILPEQRGYRKLIVYQKAKELLLLTYKITKSFPKVELYVLLPQMRRAALSIPANIVEGYTKHSRRDFARFLDISLGSAGELGLFLEISLDLGYINTNEFKKADALLTEVKKLLYSFRRSLKGDPKS